MKARTGPLLAVAAAVADGSTVDWDYLERGTAGKDRPLVEQLRVIARIAASHQASGGPPAADSDADTAPGTGSDRGTRDAPDVGTWGRFVLIEELGHGGFGTVYRAQDPLLNRPVAVKLPRERAGEHHGNVVNLFTEGQALARVNHPNVVQIYEAGEHDGKAGLCMEFVRGLTLEQMLVSHGPFSAAEACLIGHEICAALAAVHLAGLVHRDVKAQNVMREEGGRLVLMDFGVGRRYGQLDPAAGRIVGTPLYLAPEVLAGARATEASDLYSVGVLLYHLVTDDFPVKASSFQDLLKAHERRAATDLQERRVQLPAGFVHAVERAIHPDPEKRFDSASQLQVALTRAFQSGLRGSMVPRLRPPGTRTGRRGGAVSRERAGDPASVAVLPFSDMSPAKDQESFCDGLTEELINALTQISGLRVAARTSTFQFKGRARDARQVGHALAVATVMDGSVQKFGRKLRITAELVSASDGYLLWSQRFDRSLEDVFAVQDEIAGAIVQTLKGRLKSGPTPSVLAPRNKDVDAYASYLEGRYHWNKRTEDGLRRSLACFERAIRRDPEFAEAYAGLADAYLTLGTYGCLPPQDVMRHAKDALEHALSLDDNLAEAYACRACVRAVYDWSWAEAERDFRHAVELNPAYPTARHWLAINHLVPLGRFDEASEELRKALELDPLSLAIKVSFGIKSYFAGQYGDAAQQLSDTIEFDERFGIAHFFLGATYTEQGRYPEALAALETAMRLSGRTPEVLAALGYLHGLSGDQAAARGVLMELGQTVTERYVSPARLAQVHVALGETAEALDRLDEARAERAADLAWVGVRPVFASLRREPRFRAIVEGLGLTSPAGA